MRAVRLPLTTHPLYVRETARLSSKITRNVLRHSAMARNVEKGNRLRPHSSAQIYCIPRSIGVDHRNGEDLRLRSSRERLRNMNDDAFWRSAILPWCPPAM